MYMLFGTWLNAKPGRGPGIAFLLGALIFTLNARLATHIGFNLLPQWIWFFTILGIVLVLAVLGAAVNGQFSGVLIDNRNRVSLSKFQIVLWTVLILSAGASAAAYKATTLGASQALNLGIPYELIVAMGISASSFAGTPFILSAKADKMGSQLDLRHTADKLSLDMKQVNNTGLVFGRTAPKDASWADLFRGDDTANAASVDLSKVQQFLISVGLVGMYGGLLWMYFVSGEILEGFPKLSDQFVWLLGISHASYLAYKAMPHSQTTGEPALDARSVG